jgi:hypothetical protein
VLRPKVAGAAVLDRLTRGLDLECFVLFSSMSAALGIVTSGYSSDDVLSDPSRHGFQAALLKPYAVEDLARVLQP